MQKTSQNNSLAALKYLRLLFLFVGAFLSTQASQAQNCAVNAGGNQTVCGSATTLTGSAGGTLGAGSPVWSFISGPSAPVIASPNNLTTNVSGMIADGVYLFQLSQPCGIGTATSQVAITAHNRPASFTAGPDKTNMCATAGGVTLNGVIPPGYTGSWSAIQIFPLESQNSTVTGTSFFSSTTTGNPVFSVPANHNTDPAYYAVLTIVSSDGICSYKDTTVVRFCPNPALQVANSSICVPGNGLSYFDLPATSPAFSTTTPGSAGAAANGTTITLNVSSQPAGGNIVFQSLNGRRITVTGATTPGNYTFTITVNNCCGSVTSAPMTFTVNGAAPNFVDFQPAGHAAPEQLTVYASSYSGGEVHCGIANTATPELFYFDVDAANPGITTTVTNSGMLPPGASTPVITLSGAGTQHRIASVNPGASGWKVGTYRFTVTSGTSPCTIAQVYYIHIAAGNNPTPLAIADTTLCYSGSGTTSGNIKLPAVYQGAINPSYLQDFLGYYNFQVISKPAGASTPQFPTPDQRRITQGSVTISNLDKAGDYVIRATTVNGNGVGPFLEQEYACSGVSGTQQDTFVIHLEEVISASAGGDQLLSCGTTTTTLVGNGYGPGSGLWSIGAVPSGAIPALSAAANPVTDVTAMSAAGNYYFAWTITNPSGNCKTSDTVLVTIDCPLSIRLLEFTADKQQDQVRLQWTTATEHNSKGFDLERSGNGTAWQSVGFVNTLAADGNSDKPLKYTYTDDKPLDGSNYYRLKQLDRTGAHTYSPVRIVNRNGSSTFEVYPNPAKNKITITGLSGSERIYIYDATGKRVMQLINKNETVAVDITHLSSGMYHIQCVTEAGSPRATRHFIVSK